MTNETADTYTYMYIHTHIHTVLFTNLVVFVLAKRQRQLVSVTLPQITVYIHYIIIINHDCLSQLSQIH